MIRPLFAILLWTILCTTSLAQTIERKTPGGGMTCTTRISADTTGTFDAGPAIRSAMVSNTVACLPVGTYLVKTVIGATGISNWTLQGSGYGTVLLKGSALADKLIQCNNCSHVRITSFKIDSSVAPNSQAGQANDGIYIAGTTSNHIEVDHIWYYGGASYSTAGGDSAIFMSASKWSVHENVFDSCWDTCVYVSGIGSGDTTLSDGRVYGNQFNGSNNGIESKRLFHNLIATGNIFDGGVNGYAEGEADTSNLPGYDSTVVANHCIGLTGDCVIFRMSSGSVASGNTSRNSSSTLTNFALQGATGALLDGNFVVYDSGFSPPAGQTCIDAQARTFNSTTYNSTQNTIRANQCGPGLTTALKEDDANQDFNAWTDNKIGGVYTSTGVSLAGTHSFVAHPADRVVQGITAGFGGAVWHSTQAGFQSTNGNTTNIFTLSIGSSRAVRLKAIVVGSSSGSNAITVEVDALFIRNSSGTLTSVLNNSSNSATNLGGTPSAAWFMDTGANAARLQVTGVAGTNITWVANIQYLVVATNT